MPVEEPPPRPVAHSNGTVEKTKKQKKRKQAVDLSAAAVRPTLSPLQFVPSQQHIALVPSGV